MRLCGRPRCHGEARVRDTEPRYFLGKHETCGFHGLPVSPTFCLATGTFEAFPQDQLMHLTHGPTCGQAVRQAAGSFRLSLESDPTPRRTA